MKNIRNMSFKDYLSEQSAITPPSGNKIGPNTAEKPGQPETPAAPGAKIKAIWPGDGAPLEKGMTVGLSGENNLPIPGEVTQIDQAAKGVKVKNPTTGQEEWQNMDALQAYTSVDEDLQRIMELAGLRENCSAGATGAGAIAMAPVAMGKMKKRNQSTEESLKAEYTPKEPAKSIVGDTKPYQASGKLSADLAASGKKSAARKNNGLKK